MWSKGFVAEETKAAFARAGELAAGRVTPGERFDAYYGRWVRCVMRGELGRRGKWPRASCAKRNAMGRPTEAGVAHRLLGIDSASSKAISRRRERIASRRLRLYDPERDREAKFRFGTDTRRAWRGLSGSRDLALGRGRTRAGADRRGDRARSRIRSCPDARQRASLSSPRSKSSAATPKPPGAPRKPLSRSAGARSCDAVCALERRRPSLGAREARRPGRRRDRVSTGAGGLRQSRL